MQLDNIVAVLPVKDFATARDWYAALLGRPADVEPMDDVAEWQIADKAWIQVGVDPDVAGKSSVILGVSDLDAHVEYLRSSEIADGVLEEYPVVKTFTVLDPEGNKVVFVEEVTS
ncbi:VOC family protein [Rhodococcoides kyotonense]|uniref:VOC domain-containing protein n=1 Tax=Rhodococcoides kyotonense TaxID=398843 RepID=A0A239LJ39_9NOCA|nr:VOC family protein [Rhodococcus kyotonensis]SNT30606.1 hypothetical protein SAMN05421642_113102 [Rhodococcus kyotonensis]